MSGYPLDEDLIPEVEHGGWGLRVWEPPTLAVVLGRSGVAEREARVANCGSDGVPILRRLGGGGAVVLAPGCLVISLAKRVERALGLGACLEVTVTILADALRDITGVPVVSQGTGDLCARDRKLLGSSVFRRRHLFFYQASLLVSMNLRHVERYLRHPPREPRYRRARSHLEFLTTLRAEGCTLSVEDLVGGVKQEVSRRVGEIR